MTARVRKGPSPAEAAAALEGDGFGKRRVLVAERFTARLLGLMFRKDMPDDAALLIPRCNAIHTFFMRFPIDVTFLDRNGAPVKTVRGVRPWTPLVWGGRRACAVAETRANPAATRRTSRLAPV